MKKTIWTISALVLLSLLTPAMAGKKNKDGGKVNPMKLMLKDKLPPVSKEDLAFQEVPFAPGAPAVVLLDGKQIEFKRIVTEVYHTITKRLIRVKILNDRGVEDHGDRRLTFDRDTIIDKIEARTVLPDGSEIDASDNIHQDETRTGGKIVSVTFPQVRTGAILDLLVIAHTERYTSLRWSVQRRIPVMDSRFILAPPSDLQFKSTTRLLSQEEAQPHVLKSTRGNTLVWNFLNVEPVPEEPNQAPWEDCTKTLYIVPTALHGPGYHIDFASTWDRWAGDEYRWWEGWMNTRRAAKALAAEVTAGLESPVEKAEAIRRALRDRIEVFDYWDVPLNNSPDDTLAKGTGYSADVAGTTAAMLRSVGVQAHLAAYRHRDDGALPADFPMPILFNDLLIRIRTGEGDLYFSPTARCRVTVLPSYCSGVNIAVIDEKTTGPIQLGDFSAGQNRAVRTTRLELDDQGNLTGESTQTFRNAWAERWRNLLLGLPEDLRIATVRDRCLRRHMPGAEVESLEIEDLADFSKPLVLNVKFRVEGYATSAGKRLIAVPNVFGRMESADWAAEKRYGPIDLGGAFEETDTVMLKFPAGFADVELPDGSNFNAGQTATYKMSYSLRGSLVVAKRTLRFNSHKFTAESWPSVKQLALDIANQDEQPVVLSLP